MAMDSLICVVVQNMSGDRLELEADPQITFRELKRHIAKHWLMPRACQKLLLGNKFLDDSEALAAHLEGGTSLLALTLVASRPATAEGPLAERLATDALQDEGFAVLRPLRSTGRFLTFSVREQGALGRGSDTYVAKAFALSGLEQKARIAVQQEVTNFQAVAAHPNLIGYCQNFLDDTGDTLVVVMSCAEGEELRSAISEAQAARSRLSGASVLRWTSQVLAGLRHLHTRRVLHRDLNPSSIFLSEGRQSVRIGELGVSYLLEPQVFAQLSGEVPLHARYLSPELIMNEGYGIHTDMWALGCIIFELCTLRVPFEGNSLFGLALEIAEKEPDWTSWGGMRDLLDITQRLLSKCGAERPTAAGLLVEPPFADMPSRGARSEHEERTPDARLASSPLYQLVAGEAGPHLLSPVKQSRWAPAPVLPWEPAPAHTGKDDRPPETLDGGSLAVGGRGAVRRAWIDTVSSELEVLQFLHAEQLITERKERIAGGCSPRSRDHRMTS
uniref:non-specific serine/threonine protein kinase n=1 Tax=Pyrodinium bahamense TaxID=73915 RepID=A0A7S0FQ00_9DINO|mmetsp:Transcript_41700/g.116199  ORF Transcript_41700/g.116199 Transcript_41700/m.116199 type:complete len:501 (+) Transcript_41700:63-1565(+)